MAGKIKLIGRDADIAHKMLHRITRIMEFCFVPYYLEAGTLLGIVRENRLLPWDNDLDISIFEKDIRKLLFASYFFFLIGYKVSYRKYKGNIGPLEAGGYRILKVRNVVGFFRKGEVILDIFVKKKYKNNYYWVEGIKTKVLKSTPAEYLEHQIKIEFNEKEYFIPANYEAYLTHRYGNWRTPVKTWDHKKDDYAIVQNWEKNE